MVYKFFYKKSAGNGVNMHANNECPLDLAEELHKPVIRKFLKITVYSGFKDKIWGADLADMQLISKFNKGFKFLLCLIDIFSKYAEVIPLKDKKVLQLLMFFRKFLKNLIQSQTKYGLTKEVYFMIVPLKNHWKIMTLKCICCWKDLSEL